MAPVRRRGFAALNDLQEETGEQEHVERIEAAEARLVQQYRQALQHIVRDQGEAAQRLLLQLLDEPLLQPSVHFREHEPPSGDPQTSHAKKMQSRQQPAIMQSRVLQGLRPKILHSLAPLLGQTQRALEVWAEILNQEPSNASIWEEISIVLAHLGHLSLAVYAASKAVVLRPADIHMHERLIVLLVAQEDWDGLINALTNLARCAGHHPWLQNLPAVFPANSGCLDINSCIPNVTDLTAHVLQQHRAQLLAHAAPPMSTVHQQPALPPGNSACAPAAAAVGCAESAATACAGDIVLWEVDGLQQLLQLLADAMEQQYALLGQGDGSVSSDDNNGAAIHFAGVQPVPGKLGVAAAPGRSVNADAGVGMSRQAAAAPLQAALPSPAPPMRVSVKFVAAVGVDGSSATMKAASEVQPMQPFNGPPSNAPLRPQQTPVATYQTLEVVEEPASCTTRQPHGDLPEKTVPSGSTSAPGNVEPQQQLQQHDPNASIDVRSLTSSAAAAAGRSGGGGRSSKSGGLRGSRSAGSALQGSLKTGSRATSNKAAVISPAELVTALVGVWLDTAVENGPMLRRDVDSGEASTPCAAAAAAAGAHNAVTCVSLQQAPQPPTLPQLQQPKPRNGGKVQEQGQHQEQQLLKDLCCMTPTWPQQLAEHLLQRLLPLVEASKLPAGCLQSLLCISQHLACSNALSAQLHLLLSELHLDVALQLQSKAGTSSNADKTGTSQKITSRPPAAGVRQQLSAAGANNTRAAAAAGSAAAAQAAPQKAAAAAALAGKDDHTARPQGHKQQPPALPGCLNGSACNTQHGLAVELGVTAPAAEQRRQEVRTAAPAAAPKLRQIRPASAPACDARSSAPPKQTAARGSSLMPHQSAAGVLEQQRAIAKHLNACKTHLQSSTAAEVCRQLQQCNRTHAEGSCQHVLWGKNLNHGTAGQQAAFGHVGSAHDPFDTSDLSQYIELLQQLQQHMWREGKLHDKPDTACSATAGGRRSKAVNVNEAARQLLGLPTWVLQRCGCEPYPKPPAADGPAESASEGMVCWQPWGPMLSVPGPQRYQGSSVLQNATSPSAASNNLQHLANGALGGEVAPAAGRFAWGTIRQSQRRLQGVAAGGSERHLGQDKQQHLPWHEQQQSLSSQKISGSCLFAWIQQAFNNSNNGLLTDVLLQHLSSKPHEPAQQETTDNMDAQPNADFNNAAVTAAAAAIRSQAVRMSVRKLWVLSRLLQAQGHLAKAADAGRACLAGLCELSVWESPSSHSHAGSCVGRFSKLGPTAAAPGISADQQQQLCSIALMHCQLDTVISATTVRAKLDEMCLSQQLLSAQKQLQEVRALMQQVQELSSRPHEQPLGDLMPVVEQVHRAARSIIEALSPRCLTTSGEVTPQQLSGVAIVQKAAQYGAAAATAALKAFGCQPAAASTAEEIRQQQQGSRCVFLQCILMRLQHALKQHCGSASAPSLKHSKHGSSGTSSTAEMVEACLQDLIKFWQALIKPKVPQAAARECPEAAAHVASAQVRSTQADAAQQQSKQEQRKEIQKLQAAADMVTATAVAGQTACAANLMLLGQRPELASLLERVQHSLLLLLTHSVPALPVPTIHIADKMPVAAAAAGVNPPLQGCVPEAADGPAQAAGPAAVTAAAAAAAGMSAASSADAEMQAGQVEKPAGEVRQAGEVAVRSSKRARIATSTAKSAAQQCGVPGAAAAASDSGHAKAKAGSRRGAASTAAVKGTSKASKSLCLQSHLNNQLLVDAGIGILALQDMHPRFSGDAGRTFKLVEGLYALLSLRIGNAWDAHGCKFLKVVWNRLFVLLHCTATAAAQQNSSSVLPPQLNPTTPLHVAAPVCSAATQHMVLLRALDGALGQLLADLYSLRVPWRDLTFGRAPLVELVARKAATQVAATLVMLPSSTNGSLPTPAARPEAPHNCLVTSAIAAAALQAALTAPIAAAAIEARPGPASSMPQVSPEAVPSDGGCFNAYVKQGIYKPRCLSSKLDLQDLLCAWQYVTLDVLGRQELVSALVDPMKAAPQQRLCPDASEGQQDCTGAASAYSRRSTRLRLIGLAKAAAWATLQQRHQCSMPCNPGQDRFDVAAGRVTDNSAADAVHSLCSLADCRDVAAVGSVGPQTAMPADQEFAADSCGESDEEGGDHAGSAVLDDVMSAQTLYWQRLAPLLHLLKQQLPPLPHSVAAAASTRLASIFGGCTATRDTPAPAQAPIATSVDMSGPSCLGMAAPTQQQPAHSSASTSSSSDLAAQEHISTQDVQAEAAPLGAAPAGLAGACTADTSVAVPEGRTSTAQGHPGGDVEMVDADELPSAVLDDASGNRQAPAPASAAVKQPAELFGWTEADLQLLRDGRAWCSRYDELCSSSWPAALKPLEALHAQVAAARRVAEPPRLKEVVTLESGGLQEMRLLEQQLELDLAVSPGSAEAWFFLGLLYLDSLGDSADDGLLESAAQQAPARLWRQAAAAAAAAAAPQRTHNANAGSSPKAGTALQDHVCTLQQLSRKALHAIIVATHLLQQQDSDNSSRSQVHADGAAAATSDGSACRPVLALPPWPSLLCPGREAARARRATLLSRLGVLLQDAACCIGPWFEPWRLRPPRGLLRSSMLMSAQLCLDGGMHALAEWERQVVLGQLASKLQHPGWQARALECYAHACHLSMLDSSSSHCGAAKLLPYVKLHGLRLKLLAAAVGPAAACSSTTSSAAVSSSVDRPAAPTGPAGHLPCGVPLSGEAALMAAMTAHSGQGDLTDLLTLLELVGSCCFDVHNARTLEQGLLPQLRAQVLAMCETAPLPPQQQQQLLMLLMQVLQQQWHAEDAAAGAAQALPAVVLDSAQQHGIQGQREVLSLLQKAVTMLIEDSTAALRYCNACCKEPLGPACYSLAKGMFDLGRYAPALSALEQLFRPSGAPDTASLSDAGAGPAGPPWSATQLATLAPLELSLTPLAESEGIKTAFAAADSSLPGPEGNPQQVTHSMHLRKRTRSSDSNDSQQEAALQQQQQQEQQLCGGFKTAGRQHNDTQHGTVSAGPMNGNKKRRRISSTAAAGGSPVDLANRGTAGASGSSATGRDSAGQRLRPVGWGSKPLGGVSGWGVDEGNRQAVARMRRQLLLYARLLYLHNDAPGLVSMWQALVAASRSITFKNPGYDPSDLGELAMGLHIRLLVDSFAPLLQMYATRCRSHGGTSEPQQQQGPQGLVGLADGALAGAEAGGGDLGMPGPTPAPAAQPANRDAAAEEAAQVLQALQLSNNNRQHKVGVFVQCLKSSSASVCGSSGHTDSPAQAAMPCGSGHQEDVQRAQGPTRPQQQASTQWQLQLADGFQLLAVCLQLALTPGQQALQLGRLLRCADEILGLNTPAAPGADAVHTPGTVGEARTSGSSRLQASDRQQQSVLPLRDAAVGLRLSHALQHLPHGVEQLLFFLASVHVELQQQQQGPIICGQAAADAAAPSAPASEHAPINMQSAAACAGCVPAGPSEGLKQAAKLLKGHLRVVRSLSLDRQVESNMASGLCKQVLDGLLSQQQQQLSTIQNSVMLLLACAQLPRLEPLQVEQQAPPSSEAPVVERPVPTAAAAQVDAGLRDVSPGQQAGTTGTAQDAKAAAGMDPQGLPVLHPSTAAAAALQPPDESPTAGQSPTRQAAEHGRQSGGGVEPTAGPLKQPADVAQSTHLQSAAALLTPPRCRQPGPSSHAPAAEDGGLDLPGAATPPVARGRASGTPSAAAGGDTNSKADASPAMRDRHASTPPMPTSGLPAEGRRAPRAAALASKDRLVQALSHTFAGAAAASAAATGGSSKVRIVPLAPARVSALELLQPLLKSLQDLIKAQYGQLSVDNAHAKQYKGKLHDMVWAAVTSSAVAAGLSVEALAGSNAVPKADKQALDVLKVSIAHVNCLLDACVAEKLVTDSEAASAAAAAAVAAVAAGLHCENQQEPQQEPQQQQQQQVLPPCQVAGVQRQQVSMCLPQSTTEAVISPANAGPQPSTELQQLHASVVHM